MQGVLANQRTASTTIVLGFLLSPALWAAKPYAKINTSKHTKHQGAR
jgi:hypothetical protein